ncbi:MAG: homocysteine S-methyltransferase family protein [Candidatus Hodarchaeales archaeon]|jgi:methionine synthase I (cobalamin-dependent)
MLTFLEAVQERPIIFDGAMGTELLARGLVIEKGTSPELWNVTNPEIVQEIHQSYYDAGADVILTNTFGGTQPKLAKLGLGDRVHELNFAAAKLAKEMVPPKKYVAGDIGPTGLMLPPMGAAKIDDFVKAFAEQATALWDGGVDLFTIETMYDLREATAAVEAVRKVSADVPIIASMTFQKKERGFFTIIGDTPDKCFRTLEEAGTNLVGSNCSLNSDEMASLFKEYNQATELPTFAEPNAGQPQTDDKGQTYYTQTPEAFAEDIARISELGVRVVGGCCGTNPSFISKIAERLKG